MLHETIYTIFKIGLHQNLKPGYGIFMNLPSVSDWYLEIMSFQIRADIFTTYGAFSEDSYYVVLHLYESLNLTSGFWTD